MIDLKKGSLGQHVRKIGPLWDDFYILAPFERIMAINATAAKIPITTTAIGRAVINRRNIDGLGNTVRKKAWLLANLTP